VGGFRQWLKHGRAVRKGERGAMIWTPTGGRRPADPTAAAPAADAPAADGSAEPRESGFIISTVFDISQTDELGAQAAQEATTAAPEPETEAAQAPAPAPAQPPAPATLELALF
ncbi:MAG: hypothetical protein ACOYD4_03850, partial [Solirubrobacterales bacterium]